MRFVLFYIVFVYFGSYAQDSIPTFGIKASMDIASIVGKDIEKFSHNGYQNALTGEVIGIYFNNKISKHFWLKHEIKLARRFLNVKMIDANNNSFTSNVKRQYLDVYPSNVVFQIKGFQVYSGAYLGILLNGSIQRKDTLGKLYKDKSFSSDNSNSSIHANKLDVGVVLGLEYEFKMGLNLGAHYTRGFIPLIENGIQKNKIYNQYYGLSLGYSFVR